MENTRLAEIMRWLEMAAPGALLHYHTGNLAADRAQLHSYDRPEGRITEWVYNLPVHSVGAMMMRAENRGLVHLMQYRVKEGVCAYFAVRTPVPYGETRKDA